MIFIILMEKVHKINIYKLIYSYYLPIDQGLLPTTLHILYSRGSKSRAKN